MNVSTDPRVLKQLLASQWLNPADILSSRESVGLQNGEMFNLLLQQLLAGTAETQSMAAPVSENGNIMPVFPNTAKVAGAQLRSAEASSAYDDLITAAAAKYGVDPALVKGVIQVESGFDAAAVSPAGAKGLMQLMDSTAKGLGVENSWDPAQNIDAGTRYLSYLLRKYDGNVYSALAAYNAGPGRVDRLGLTHDEIVRARYSELPDETQRYIPKVLQAAQQWSLKV